MKPYLLTLLIATFVVASACESRRDQLPTLRTEIPFRKDGTLVFERPDGGTITEIAIEIADTDSAQMRGLMDRRSLPRGSGMLFVNESAEDRSFWMRNTPMPLDIIFVGSDSAVVNIARRTRPYTDDRVTSEGPAQFVVEVRAGFVDRYGITDSTRIRWRRD